VPERSEPKRNCIDVCTVCTSSTTLGIILLGEYVGHCTFFLSTFIPKLSTFQKGGGVKSVSRGD
jgi:hypothetical protein